MENDFDAAIPHLAAVERFKIPGNRDPHVDKIG